MSKREALIKYIKEQVDDEFEPDQDLLDIMDSVTLLQFMVHIEQTFGVTIDRSELMIENFESIDAVIEAFFDES
jgi:acyl carrier protein